MVCPRCSGKVLVVDTVNIVAENEIYRKRTCTSCGHTFFTTEFIVERTKLFISDWNDNYRKESK